jgi:hypothetical protein
MHAAAFEFVKAAAEVYALHAPVYEIGSRNINGSVRSLFAAGAYWGVDLQAGRDVDCVADACTYRPPFAPCTVICCEVLEHAREAATLVRRIGDVLAPEGMAVLTMAGPTRAPHSGIDGGAVRDGEFYRNVTVSLVEAWLQYAGLRVVVLRERGADVYAVAAKP